MASKRRPRRRDKDNKPKSKGASEKEQLPSGPTSLHHIPDHLLELILLRLHSSACVLRAAAACKRWRRVITAAGFLSRSLSTHCVAGHYHAFDPDWVDYGSPPITGNPVFVPSPSLTVDGRRLSLNDFLPDSDSGWALADSRGSLLLLFKRRTGWAARANTHSFPDVVVCEPLTRRCQGILSPEHTTCLGVFLLDGDRGIGMSDFRIVAVLHEDHESEEGRAMPVACVFSMGNDGGWRVLPSVCTNSASVSLPGSIESISFAGRANGCLYWAIGGEEDGGAILAFDDAAMAFSRVPFPADDDNEGSDDRWSFRVIGSGEDGALRVVRTVRNELTVHARRQGSGDEWVLERLVRLREATAGLPGRSERFFQRNAMIMAAHETYVLVTPQEKTWLFSVDLETLQVEREHERNKYAGQAYPSELPWPPSLTARTDERGRRRRS
ncbi:hypothetical protein BAE44_0017151 [Dichanthelium oligosanthes]|uniref:F-box domain-containing protein n=1 Tax=Dichanthelium oligosanthes TaxID=888268 RepID=A0A1E5V9J5_9POAL|nr:hypothetical protein BAE44_0017151 [Dichanthelium oligosanthes]